MGTRKVDRNDKWIYSPSNFELKIRQAQSRWILQTGKYAKKVSK